MPDIRIDQDVYDYLCRNTKVLGEDASTILRRLLNIHPSEASNITTASPSVAPNLPPRPATLVTATPELPRQEEEDERIEEFLNSVGYRTCEHAVDRFLWMLTWLESIHRNTFHKVETIQGHERLYFSKSKEELERHGNSVDAQQISRTGYWVVTNSDVPKKARILADVMRVLGYRSWNTDRVVDDFLTRGGQRVTGQG